MRKKASGVREDISELDRVLGIRTDLVDREWRSSLRHPCQPSPIQALTAAAERLLPEGAVADLGCGTGRAVFALAMLTDRHVIGIEADPARFLDAEENLRRCGNRAPAVAERIRLVCADACALTAEQLLFTEPAGSFYCFNPFPARVLRGVLAALCTVYPEGTRLRFLCYYPDDGWTDVLQTYGAVCAETVMLAELGNDPRERLDIWDWEI